MRQRSDPSSPPSRVRVHKDKKRTDREPEPSSDDDARLNRATPGTSWMPRPAQCIHPSSSTGNGTRLTAATAPRRPNYHGDGPPPSGAAGSLRGLQPVDETLKERTRRIAMPIYLTMWPHLVQLVSRVAARHFEELDVECGCKRIFGAVFHSSDEQDRTHAGLSGLINLISQRCRKREAAVFDRRNVRATDTATRRHEGLDH
jgi:hypothetical protein